MEEDNKKCPYCQIPLMGDQINGMDILVCPECGRVFEEDIISVESEQRFFDIEDLYQQSRLIKTQMDHPSLADSQPYSGSSIIEDYRSRRILELRSLVHKVSQKLQIHPDVEKKAISLLLDFHQKRNLKQKDMIAFVLASLYIATRLKARPVPLDNILKKIGVPKKEFSKAFRTFKDTLKIRLPPSKPSDFINYITNSLKLSYQCEKIALELARAVEEKMILSGRDPLSIAAACSFIAADYTGENRAQREFTRVVHCTEVTLRTRVREVLDCLGGRKEINRLVEGIYQQFAMETSRRS